ncbi:LEM-3-like GIY-YIG domain-containing protein [Sporosarcina sp. FSL K6-3457]|uniref:LEM-3-like GIY-YIG domain-containing protein n=1 Tax=Sporosarcina sp. FSL K6-3457 TaxID=2978204 RepID=UPI0030F9842B
MIKQFSKEVINKLKYYVYIYSDPETDEIFYVGKGIGNRVFSHLTDTDDTEKSRFISRILDRGQEPKIEMLIHGLEDEHTSLKVEAAIIDLIGKEKLTNRVRGWQSGIFGRVEVNQLISHYEREKVYIDEPAILIRINRLFRYDMTDIELYDATRGVWKIGENREKAKYALAVFDGIVHEVYEVIAWFQAGSTFNTRGSLDEDKKRWEFVGKKAEESIRSKYIRKSVEHYHSRSAQNPIKYVNIIEN